MNSRTCMLHLAALACSCVRIPATVSPGDNKDDAGSSQQLEGASAAFDGQAGGSASSAEPTPSAAAAADPNVPTIAVAGTSTVAGDAIVAFMAPTSTTVTALTTTLTVPQQPLAVGTLFVLSGLQPNGANLQPIDNGILESVLTWGSSCAPGMQPAAYSTWWTSAQYVNSYGKEPGYVGCTGGDVMAVAPGDRLTVLYQLIGTQWQQTISNARDAKTVSFALDMQGQAQNKIVFLVSASAPSSDSTPVAPATAEAVFTDTLITFADPSPETCSNFSRGARDAVVGIKTSVSGLRCSIDKMVLRSQGAEAVDPAPPGP